MEAPFDTTFLVRRHTQLLVQAADLPERSSAQAHIEQLACKLSVYVSKLADEPSKKRRARRTGCFSENAEHCAEGCCVESTRSRSTVRACPYRIGRGCALNRMRG